MTTHIIPIRPKPIKNETAGSFLTRCCEQNGYGCLKQFVHCNFIDGARSTLSTICTSYARYDKITRSLGLSVDSHRLVCERLTTNHTLREFNGVRLPHKLFRADLSSFCPKCLADSAHWRQEWLLRFYLVCPQHSCALVHVCPTCKKAPQLGRGELCVCDTCGEEFNKVEAPLASAESSAWIIAKVNSGVRVEVDKIMAVILIFFELDIRTYGELQIMISIQNFFENRAAAVKSLAKSLSAKSFDYHPTFTLLPLLRANQELRDFAEKVLARLKYPVKCLAPRDLNRREACAVLNISVQVLRTDLITAQL